jgi:preprotein translocase subunit SecF
MELIKPGTNIDFVGKRRIAYSLSLSMIALTVFTLIWRGGPNYGIDFAGGLVIQVKLEEKQTPYSIREALKSLQLEDSIVQEFEGKSEYLIRITKPDIEMTQLGERVKQALVAKFGEGIDLRHVEMVGPQVSEDLRQKALFAIYYSILFMAVYISGRFEMKWTLSIIMALALCGVTYVASTFGVNVSWLIIIGLLVTLGLCWVLKLKYALGAIIALIHDVIVTIGSYALTNREISFSTVAALLTIVGYSLNDTIIIYDRVRENLRHTRKQSLAKLINNSVNQTLSRTILTTGTTLIVVLALFLLGGPVIHDFAFALLVGFVVGTYSSVYVASPILLLLEERGIAAPKSDSLIFSVNNTL